MPFPKVPKWGKNPHSVMRLSSKSQISGWCFVNLWEKGGGGGIWWDLTSRRPARSLHVHYSPELLFPLSGRCFICTVLLALVAWEEKVICILLPASSLWGSTKEVSKIHSVFINAEWPVLLSLQPNCLYVYLSQIVYQSNSNTHDNFHNLLLIFI